MLHKYTEWHRACGNRVVRELSCSSVVPSIVIGTGTCSRGTCFLNGTTLTEPCCFPLPQILYQLELAHVFLSGTALTNLAVCPLPQLLYHLELVRAQRMQDGPGQACESNDINVNEKSQKTLSVIVD